VQRFPMISTTNRAFLLPINQRSKSPSHYTAQAQNHRRRSSVNFGQGQNILPENIQNARILRDMTTYQKSDSVNRSISYFLQNSRYRTIRFEKTQLFEGRRRTRISKWRKTTRLVTIWDQLLIQKVLATSRIM